jgi:hypothetical protein
MMFKKGTDLNAPDIGVGVQRLIVTLPVRMDGKRRPVL